MGKYYLYTAEDKTQYIVKVVSLDNIKFIKADGSQSEWFEDFKLEVDFLNDSILDMAQEVELDGKTGDLVYKDIEKAIPELTTEQVIQMLQIKHEPEPGEEE